MQYIIGSEAQSQLALDLLTRLYSLHAIYSASRPLCDHEIASFCYNACEFGHWFPLTFPKHRITPKMHVMIYHMCLVSKQVKLRVCSFSSNQNMSSINLSQPACMRLSKVQLSLSQ